MDATTIAELISFILLILLSGFFSGSETALFSLSKLSLQRMAEEKRKNVGKISALLKKPQRLLVTILVGNTLVNVAAATVAILITTDLSHKFGFGETIGLILDVLVVSFVLLVCGEITPKVYAAQHAERFSLLVATGMGLVSSVLLPITKLLTTFMEFLASRFGKKEGAPFVTEEELKTMVEVGEEEGDLEEEEKEMIHSIFEFGETCVKEVMVPRIDMVCVEAGAGRSEILDLIRRTGYSRIPLCKGNVDNIKGVVYAKDLLQLLSESENVDLAKLARKPYFVPEGKKIDELLREFQREKIHMAIVVDEYGGTAGLVTLEDLLEEIVGEIQDEYDSEEPLYKWIDRSTIIADARMDIHDVNHLLQVELPTDGFESLGGFIYSLEGGVPRKGEELKYGGLKFVMEEVTGHRISKVKIVRVDEE